VSVENVRLSGFAEEAGARAESMRSEVGGLLASVQGATVLGDRALLLSERALFYAQRAPFLWRLQAKVGTRDVLTEAMTTLASAQGLLAEGPRLHQALGDLNAVLARVTDVLVKSAERPETLRLSMALLDRLSGVLRESREVLVAAPLPAGRAGSVGETVEAGASRLLRKGFLYGAALVILCGVVAFGARVASRWLIIRLEARRRKGESSRDDRKAA
jgi:hypothetical protein